MAFFHRISRIKDGKEIPGRITHAFIHNGDLYSLAEIKVYQDGMIDCWELVNFEEFKQKIAEGWVVTTLPNNAPVSVSFLASFRVSDVKAGVREEEFIKEVADEVEKLNERPTSIDTCMEAFQRFQDEQNEEAMKHLKEAYEAVPDHLRWYMLQDLDANINVEAAFDALKKNGL